MSRPKIDTNNLSSGITHLCGALIALPCATLLIRVAAFHSTAAVVSFSVFGAALFLLYSASALYHFLLAAGWESTVFRKIDHMMIFVLIAGTYTPICLVGLGNAVGVGMLSAIWLLAVAGIFFKAFWLSAPRLLYTLIYVVMGWLAVFAFYPLAKALSTAMFWLLVAGGFSYTVGAVFYALKKPKLKVFGFHEIFHLFVLGGSACHIILMFFLVRR